MKRLVCAIFVLKCLRADKGIFHCWFFRLNCVIMYNIYLTCPRELKQWIGLCPWRITCIIDLLRVLLLQQKIWTIQFQWKFMFNFTFNIFLVQWLYFLVCVLFECFTLLMRMDTLQTLNFTQQEKKETKANFTFCCGIKANKIPGN